MKTKQEVIQEAYGDAWECLKGHVDDNGFVTALRENPTSDTHPLTHGFPLAEIQMKHFLDSFDWRPNSIRDIEGNNGWIRVEDKMPEFGQMLLLVHNGKPNELKFKGKHVHEFLGQGRNITHWKPVEEIKPPLY